MSVSAQDMIFKKFEDVNTPNTFTCNMCNKVGGVGFLFSDIEIAQGATFTVVVCSPICEKSFKNHKLVDEYLKNRIRAIKKMHRMNSIKNMGSR